MIELIIAIVAFIAGWKFREWLAIRVVNNYLANYNNFINEIKEEVNSRTITVKIEKDGGNFLVYNKETQEFLAQGKNHEEISTILKSRFPNMFFSADQANMTAVGYEVTKVDNDERI